MRNLAPEIYRQRLLIEGYTSRSLERADVAACLEGLAAHLGLRAYGAAAVFSPSGAGSAGNQGFDAFLPLVDSGISLYYWSSQRFVAVLLFTCKPFDAQAALEYLRAQIGLDGETERFAF